MSEIINGIAFAEVVQNAASMTLPDPDLTMFWRNADDRLMWLEGDCDDSWNVYAKMIMQWNIEDIGTKPEDRIPIVLIINTDGGDLYVCNMMIDVIMKSKTPVIGINMARAYSAGCYIFLACHKRYAMPNSWFLFHRGSGSVGGNQYDVVSQTNQWNAALEALKKFTIQRTKLSEEDFEKRWQGDYFLSAQEAADAGVADAVVDDLYQAMKME